MRRTHWVFWATAASIGFGVACSGSDDVAIGERNGPDGGTGGHAGSSGASSSASTTMGAGGTTGSGGSNPTSGGGGTNIGSGTGGGGAGSGGTNIGSGGTPGSSAGGHAGTGGASGGSGGGVFTGGAGGQAGTGGKSGGSAGGGFTGGAGGSAGAGGGGWRDAGVSDGSFANCPALLTAVQQALVEAQRCEPNNMGQCQDILEGVCCKEPVANRTSPAAMAYQQALDSYNAAHCMSACPAIPCPSGATRCVGTSAGGPGQCRYGGP